MLIFYQQASHFRLLMMLPTFPVTLHSCEVVFGLLKYSFRASLESPRHRADVLRAGKAPPLATALLSPRPSLARRPDPRRGRPEPPGGRPEGGGPARPRALRRHVTSRGSSRRHAPSPSAGRWRSGRVVSPTRMRGASGMSSGRARGVHCPADLL